jgi:hypothetical protein
VKNNFVKLILIFLLFIVSFKILHSAELLPTMTPKAFTGDLKLTTSTAPAVAGTKGSSGIFGGKIVNTKAVEIEALENTGYACVVPGTSITIVPVKGPTSFFIPFSIVSKTKRNPKVNGWTLGRYSMTTPITCTLPGNPPTTTTIYLDTISMYGTS